MSAVIKATTRGMQRRTLSADEQHSTMLSATVVVPCFNRAHFLQPTIDSILEQDHDNVECIVIDGGSTDETVEILQSYGNRIRWVSEPDDGHAAAINKGWRMGSGEVLAWLNADDTFAHTDSLSQACQYLSEHSDVDVVYGECLEIDTGGTPVGRVYSRRFDLQHAVEQCDHCIPQPAAFIRRSALERVGYLDETLRQKKDHELWLRIGLQGKIAYIPQVLACERNVPGLSYDVATAAPACVEVTDRFFSQAEVPKILIDRKRRIYSNAALRACDYAFDGGPAWWSILYWAVRSICYDPTNWRSTAGRLKRYISRRSSVTECSGNVDGAIELLNAWIAAALPAEAKGHAVVYETVETTLPLGCAMRGWQVIATSAEHRRWEYKHQGLRYTNDDLAMLLDSFGHCIDLLIVQLVGSQQENATEHDIATIIAHLSARTIIVAGPADLVKQCDDVLRGRPYISRMAQFTQDRVGRWELRESAHGGELTGHPDVVQEPRQYIAAKVYTQCERGEENC